MNHDSDLAEDGMSRVVVKPITACAFAQNVAMSRALSVNPSVISYRPSPLDRLQITAHTSIPSVQDTQSGLTGLLSLPVELLQMILRSSSEGPGKLGALVLTCRQLHVQLLEYQKLLAIIDAWSTHPDRQKQRVLLKQPWMSFKLLNRANTYRQILS